MWYIIANPAAGKGLLQQQWPLYERRLQENGVAYTIQFTRHPGHGARLVQDAILKGHRRIIGMGGDGSHHDILNGILSQTEVPSQEVWYAPFPAGSGNDWARTWDIPHDPQQRIARLLQPQVRLQDAGKISLLTPEGTPTERWFINVAGMAYDAEVVRRMLEDGISSGNRFRYILAVARYLMEYEPVKATVIADGNEPHTNYFYTINAGICRYSGGGMQIVPHAVPDDGLLAVTLAQKMPKWEVLAQTPRFYNGSLLKHPKVAGHQNQNLTVLPADDRPVWVEADGEFLGKCPAVFTLLEKAISVVL